MKKTKKIMKPNLSTEKHLTLCSMTIYCSRVLGTELGKLV